MVLHHGAGYSALSFAMMAKEITAETGGECGVLSLDCRRHGALSNQTYGPGKAYIGPIA